MTNVEKFNFTYNGCEIKFYQRPDNFDVDMIVSKGNLRRHFQICDLIKVKYGTDKYGCEIIRYIDCTEERIAQIKEKILKGELELI